MCLGWHATYPVWNLGDRAQECDNTGHFLWFCHFKRHLTKKEHKNHEVSAKSIRKQIQCGPVGLVSIWHEVCPSGQVCVWKVFCQLIWYDSRVWMMDGSMCSFLLAQTSRGMYGNCWRRSVTYSTYQQYKTYVGSNSISCRRSHYEKQPAIRYV